VESVQNVQRRRCAFLEHLQVGWPPIGAGVLDACNRFGVQKIKKPIQTFLGPILANVQKSFEALVELVPKMLAFSFQLSRFAHVVKKSRYENVC